LQDVNNKATKAIDTIMVSFFTSTDMLND